MLSFDAMLVLKNFKYTLSEIGQNLNFRIQDVLMVGNIILKLTTIPNAVASCKSCQYLKESM